MASPMPMGAETAPLMLPAAEDQIVGSPLNSFAFPSPGAGHTPTVHALQEGRLSLEMYSLATEVGLVGNANAAVAIELLAPAGYEKNMAKDAPLKGWYP